MFERHPKALDVNVAGRLLAAQLEASDRHWRIETLEQKRIELERKRLLLELEVHRALLEAVLKSVPVGVAIYDSEMRVLCVNAEYSRLAQTNSEQSGDPFFQEPARDSAVPEQIHERVLAGEAVYRDDVCYEAQDGTVRYADFNFRPVFDLFGSVIAVIATAIDVTARHELQAQKDTFIALAAHELRTPLTSIKGFAKISLPAAARTGDERLVRSLKIIDGQCDRLARRIAELLDVSYMATQRDALPLQVEPVNYNAMVSQVISDLKIAAPNFTFYLDLADGPVWVDADQDRMEEVLTNLVGNAIKFSGDSRRVEITVRSDGQEVITSVRDFGVGIAVCDQERIFERYYRPTNVSPSRHSGLGVGLYVARTIIARHGGRMWCESNVGRGSTFYFSFPVSAVYRNRPSRGLF